MRQGSVVYGFDFSVIGPKGSARRRMVVIGLILFAGIAAHICVPRHADLRGFDPVAVARIETEMWRDYYERRHVALFLKLYDVAREQNGFSPLDSARLAFAAARAAAKFQPTRSRAEADAALPELRRYFKLLVQAAPVKVDVERVARAELDWWQARREAVAPEEYGLLIGRVSALLYGTEEGFVRRAGVMRAQAMAYRDARAGSMTDADWRAINSTLLVAYDSLKWGLMRR
jgi:hypothetical protein